MIFADRRAAGRMLAEKLVWLNGRDNVIVLALPRGGVPVAVEIAKTIHALIDVLIVRKIGVPGHEELAMGAIAGGGTTVVNDQVVRMLNIDKKTFDGVAKIEREEAQRRERVYRAGKPALDVQGKICVVVDDGIATGASMEAAVTALRSLQPSEIIVAVPVCALSTAEQFSKSADRFVVLQTPEDLGAVGAWYEHFPQLSDSEVLAVLKNPGDEPGRGWNETFRSLFR
jgi:putative phosphoribosyl transferase